MKTNYEIRYAAHPEDAKSYDTARLRRDFLIEKVFTADEVNMVYSMYDRMVVGGAMPVAETLRLEAINPLKAPFFLTRREMGIYNVGGPGVVKAGESITITVPDLPTGEMLKTYEVDKTQELKYAISRFYTNIPGLRSVETP